MVQEDTCSTTSLLEFGKDYALTTAITGRIRNGLHRYCCMKHCINASARTQQTESLTRVTDQTLAFLCRHSARTVRSHKG